MYALIRNLDNKVCAVSETEQDLKRKLNSVMCMRMALKDFKVYLEISSQSASKNWEDRYSSEYKIESVGF